MQRCVMLDVKPFLCCLQLRCVSFNYLVKGINFEENKFNIKWALAFFTFFPLLLIKCELIDTLSHVTAKTYVLCFSYFNQNLIQSRDFRKKGNFKKFQENVCSGNSFVARDRQRQNRQNLKLIFDDCFADVATSKNVFDQRTLELCNILCW